MRSRSSSGTPGPRSQTSIRRARAGAGPIVTSTGRRRHGAGHSRAGCAACGAAGGRRRGTVPGAAVELGAGARAFLGGQRRRGRRHRLRRSPRLGVEPARQQDLLDQLVDLVHVAARTRRAPLRRAPGRAAPPPCAAGPAASAAHGKRWRAAIVGARPAPRCAPAERLKVAARRADLVAPLDRHAAPRDRRRRARDASFQPLEPARQARAPPDRRRSPTASAMASSAKSQPKRRAAALRGGRRDTASGRRSAAPRRDGPCRRRAGAGPPAGGGRVALASAIGRPSRAKSARSADTARASRESALAAPRAARRGAAAAVRASCGHSS